MRLRVDSVLPPPEYPPVPPKPVRLLLNVFRPLVEFQTSGFVSRQLGAAERCHDRDALLDLALTRAPRAGLVMEFGVFKGESLRLIARRAQDRSTPDVYGFDSFLGLPRRWGWGYPVGTFDLGGAAPSLPGNAHLVTGLFEQTLNPFLDAHPEKAAFVHIDADVYSSARFVLRTLAERDRIQPGTVVQLDEAMGYTMWWRRHEFQALREVTRRFALNFRYLGYVAPAGPQLSLMFG